MDTEASVTELPGVGKTTQEKLARLGIRTLSDLLEHYPTKYHDFSKVSKIRDCKINEEVTIIAQIVAFSNRRSFRRRLTIQEARISDDTGMLSALWFNQPFIAKSLEEGQWYRFSGKLVLKRGLQLTTPVFERIDRDALHTGRIVPEYSLTAGVTHKQMRFWMKWALDNKIVHADFLPHEYVHQEKLLPLSESLQKIHFPLSEQDVQEARKRIAFNELFILQTHATRVRNKMKSRKARSIPFVPKEIQAFTKGLPFELTPDQKKASFEILKDLERSHPMNRLLEGDVGSGKTVCALLSAYATISKGYQVVFLAPTEILARQHYESAVKLLEPFGVKIQLVTSKTKIDNFSVTLSLSKSNNSNKLKAPFDKLRVTEADLIIGTHAVLEKNVKFKKLAYIIIDEQQRFGVMQRSHLLEPKRGFTPHLLSMTATPIPRSLALTLYGELDLSIIRSMPKGRKKIKTYVVPKKKRKGAYEFIRKEIQSGRQAYVVLPLIDPSENLQARAVVEEHKKLQEKVFPELRVGMLHGRMKKDEKTAIMKLFKDGKADILVSTSVIEVGVDVPNATIMMIENAERFGLAQLHQFRGRVGRGEHQSYCLLFSDDPSEASLKRLRHLEKSSDGFALAEADLEMRGPGEVYGKVQSGYMNSLKVARLSDHELLAKAKRFADEVMQKDPGLLNHPEIQKQLAQFETKVHLE